MWWKCGLTIRVTLNQHKHNYKCASAFRGRVCLCAAEAPHSAADGEALQAWWLAGDPQGIQAVLWLQREIPLWEKAGWACEGAGAERTEQRIGGDDTNHNGCKEDLNSIQYSTWSGSVEHFTRHACIDARMHTSTPTRTHTYARTRTRAHMCTFQPPWTHACTHTHARTRTRAHMCTFQPPWTHACMHAHAHTHSHTYTHTCIHACSWMTEIKTKD